MERTTKLFLTAWVAAALVSGCGGPNHIDQARAGSRLTPARAKTIVVGLRNEADSYEASGQVRAEWNVTLASKVSSRVDRVLVREGDLISKGQLLAELDPRELEAARREAKAGFAASQTGVESALALAQMEASTRTAAVRQAEAAVHQAEASLKAAEAKQDLAVAGPRPQEVQSAHLKVREANASLALATKELDRNRNLEAAGALSKRELDSSQARYDVAKSERDVALEAEKIAVQGTRAEELRAASEAVNQARAAVDVARAGWRQAQAALQEVTVRQRAVDTARAQVSEAGASLASTQVALSYTHVIAPFNGRVIHRLVDTGALASPGAPLLEVEGGRQRLEVTVPEAVIGEIHLGDQVPIHVGGDKTNLVGVVDEVVPAGDAATHTFLVKIRFTATNVRSGVYGTAALPSGHSPHLSLPVSAVLNQDGLDTVFIVGEDGTAHLRVVRLGERTGQVVEVLAGISFGAHVIADPSNAIHEGTPIQEGSR